MCRACWAVCLCTNQGLQKLPVCVPAGSPAPMRCAYPPWCSLIAASAAAAPAAVAALRASTSAARRATVAAFTGSLAGDTSHGGRARGIPVPAPAK